MFGKLGLIAAVLALSACSAATATPASPPPASKPPEDDARFSKDIERFGSVCEDFDDWDKPT